MSTRNVDLRNFTVNDKKKLDAVVGLDSGEGHDLGVVSQSELVQIYFRNESNNLYAADVMVEGVPQIPSDIPLTVAVRMMQDQKIRTFFLLHHAGGIDYPSAYLSFARILRLLAAKIEEDLIGLGVKAERKNPLDVFFRKKDAAKNKIQSQRRE